MWVDLGLTLLALGIGASGAGTFYLIDKKIKRYLNSEPEDLLMVKDKYYSDLETINSKTYLSPYPYNQLKKNEDELRMIKRTNEILKYMKKKNIVKKKHYEKFMNELEKELSKVENEIKKNLELKKKFEELGI